MADGPRPGAHVDEDDPPVAKALVHATGPSQPKFLLPTPDALDQSQATQKNLPYYVSSEQVAILNALVGFEWAGEGS